MIVKGKTGRDVYPALENQYESWLCRQHWLHKPRIFCVFSSVSGPCTEGQHLRHREMLCGCQVGGPRQGTGCRFPHLPFRFAFRRRTQPTLAVSQVTFDGNKKKNPLIPSYLPKLAPFYIRRSKTKKNGRNRKERNKQRRKGRKKYSEALVS